MQVKSKTRTHHSNRAHLCSKMGPLPLSSPSSKHPTFPITAHYLLPCPQPTLAGPRFGLTCSSHGCSHSQERRSRLVQHKTCTSGLAFNTQPQVNQLSSPNRKASLLANNQHLPDLYEEQLFPFLPFFLGLSYCTSGWGNWRHTPDSCDIQLGVIQFNILTTIQGLFF